MSRTRQPSRRTQYFSNTLLLLMEKNGVSQTKLSAATGIAVSRINNYLKGKYRTIRPDHLGLIAKVVSRNPEESGELVKAYILDLLPEVLNQAVRIEIAGLRNLVAKREPMAISMAPTASAALSRLQALGLRNAKARERIVWFSEIMVEAHST